MSARQWHKTSHRADSSGPHPRTPRNATILLVPRHFRRGNHHWGSYRDRPRPILPKRTWHAHGGPTSPKAKQNLSREPIGSANYTERRSATAPHLSRPTDKNDAKWKLNGTANMFVSGPSSFTCVDAYTCLPEATVPKLQTQQSATAPIAS